ncbi:MAG: GDP-mannose 4,6-dehydratase [Acidobacteriota bacterium]
MNCLVTGGTGFAGSSLVERLLRAGHRVWAGSRTGSAGHLAGVEGAEVLACDLRDPQAVARLVEQAAPERVYHLGAHTFVPAAYADRQGCLETNLMGTVHLLAAVRRIAPAARVLVVGSAGEYGASGRPGTRLAETAPLLPVDPYGASKAAAEMWALQEGAGAGFHVVCVRSFGHVGPRQSPRFVVADFARQIGRVACGEQEPRLEVGNLEAVREFNDVEDVAAGYAAILERGNRGSVYNVCSGRGLAIREMLDRLVRRSGVAVEVVESADRRRPADVPSLVGDPARTREETGWEMAAPVDGALDRVLERWCGGARGR